MCLFIDITKFSFGNDGISMSCRRERAMQEISNGSDVVFYAFYEGLDPRERELFYERIKADAAAVDVYVLQGCKYTIAGN